MNIILIIVGVVLVLIVGWAFLMDYIEHRNKVFDLSYYEAKNLDYVVDGKNVGLDGILNLNSSFDPSYFLYLVFHLFQDVQKAWSKNDIEALEKYYSPKLFQIYRATLENFQKDGRRNEIRDILQLSSKLCSYKIEKGKEKAEVLLTVSCYDYLVATNSGRIIEGNPDKKIAITYLLELEKEKTSEIQKVVCPNCKKEATKENQTRCEYCNQELVPTHYDWVISNKKVMKQKEL